MSSIAHVTGRLGAGHYACVVADASKPTIVSLGAECFLCRRPIDNLQRQDLSLPASAHFTTSLESGGRSDFVAPDFRRAPGAYAYTQRNTNTGAYTNTNAYAYTQSHTGANTQSGR